MSVSIVIVGFHSWSDIGEGLDVLDPTQFEVIVVDNVPEPKVAEQFAQQHPNIKVINNHANLGFGHGCNLGAAAASGDTLLLLNPDARAKAHVISAMAERLTQSNTAVLTTQLVDQNGRKAKAGDVFPSLLTLFGPIRSLVRRLRKPRSDGPLRFVDWVSGAALMIPSPLFKQLGGFSEDYFMYSEDVDLCYRVRQLGHEVAIDETLYIEHRHGGSSRANDQLAAQMRTEAIKSRHVFASKHLGPGHALAYHVALASSRMLLPLMLWPLSRLLRGKLKQRALMAPLLLNYLKTRVLTGTWVSVRAPSQQAVNAEGST
ncbi:MAG: glycosyl transferase [Lysobacteraceae bacterium]|nr:MAG: glycosyl transferase [Xanthomonadaceae bacterium]